MTPRIRHHGRAETTRLGDRVGSLTPGKKADIVLLRTDVPCMVPNEDTAT